MSSPGVAEGARTVFRDRTGRLHVYHASDSFWWARETQRNREEFPDDACLPKEREAPLLAALHFDRLQFDASAASLASVDFNEISVQNGDQAPRSFRTVVNANYQFTLDGLPVFGPGAKIKMSFAERGSLAQAIYFWRKPSRGESMKTISPKEALERVQRDPAVLRLQEESALIEVRSIQLGYYALPPAELQPFYIPVYAIGATVSAPGSAARELRLHVCAAQAHNARTTRLDVMAAGRCAL